MPRQTSRNGCCGRQRGTYITVGLLGLIIPIFFLSYYAFGQLTKPRTSIQLVSVLFRHGDRTPTETYPNDPYNDEKYWPAGWGALTNLGKIQLYKYGQYLRKRYDGALNDHYSPKDIYVVSSDHDRCLMSAQVLLAGLYPPVGDQIWQRSLNWQPIPVHTAPRNLDKLIVVKKPCPAYEKQLNNTYKNAHLTRIDEENKELYQYLTDHSGKKIKNVLDLEFLYNTLEIEYNNHLKLPDWTKSVFPHKMKDLAALSLAVFTYTDSMKKFKGGPIVADIVHHMAQKVLHTLNPDRKMFLYSGHDITIVSVLRALGFEERIKPDPGASVIVELHRPFDGSEHFVEVLYKNNSDSSEPFRLRMPNCEDPCSLKSFLEIARPLFFENWEKKCQEVD